ncbi:MAG TPA: hypothetical protein V6C85_33235, partial [Allocoleopsis sp.]
STLFSSLDTSPLKGIWLVFQGLMAIGSCITFKSLAYLGWALPTNDRIELSSSIRQCPPYDH